MNRIWITVLTACFAFHHLFCRAQVAAPPQTSAKVGVASAPTPVPQAPTTIKVYQIQHTGAIDLKTILTQLFPNVKVVLGPQPNFLQKQLVGEHFGDEVAAPPPPESKFVTDEFVRTLILSGPDADIKEALRVLEEIDTTAPQVLIEAKVIDASTEFSKQLGLLYDFNPNGPTFQFKLGNTDNSTSSGALGRLNHTSIDFNATLNAAIQNNRAKLLASPKIIVLYNHRSQIFIGDEVTYLLGSQASANGTTLQTGKVRVGVELSVVATAHPDGTITLRVHPEVGSLSQLNTLANGISLPQVSRRYTDTEVRLKDAETLVIGGLIGTNTTHAVTKLPFLGDLPLIGNLFRHESTNRTRSEVMIFVKATIVKDQTKDQVKDQTKDQNRDPAQDRAKE